MTIKQEHSSHLTQLVNYYENKIKLNPSFSWFYYKLAQAFMDQGLLDEAEIQYRTAIELNPHSASFYQSLGELLVKQNRLDEAVIYFKKAVKVYPTFTLAYKCLGQIFEKNNKLEEAVIYYKKVVVLDPKNEVIPQHLNQLEADQKSRQYVAQGLKLSKKGEWNEAVNAYQQAITFHPDQAVWVYKALGEGLIKLNRLDQAESVFIKLTERFPNHHAGFRGLIEVAQKQEDLVLALKQLEAYQKKFPNDFWAYLSKGHLLIKLKKLDEAEIVLSEFYHQYPQNIESLLGLAHIAEQKQQWEFALKALNSYIDQYPDKIKAIVPQMINLFKKLIERQPNQPLEVYKRLAYELEMKGEIQSSISVLNGGIHYYKSEPWLYNRLAALVARQGDLEQALKYYLKSVDTRQSQKTSDFFKQAQAKWLRTNSLDCLFLEGSDYEQTLKLVEQIQAFISQQKPMSAIRLGDGEGLYLSDLQTIVPIYYGKGQKYPLSHQDKINLNHDFLAALRNTDILGLPREDMVTRNLGYWYSVEKMPQDILDVFLKDPHRLITDQHFSWHLQENNLFKELLSGLKFCGLVSCRNIVDNFKKVYGIQDVVWYRVPGEKLYLDLSQESKPHFPDFYHQLKQDLTVPFPGALFLVGAGLLGKIYCNWIKERGGIAIDIGAVFDTWAGDFKTRPFVITNLRKKGSHTYQI